MGPIAIVGMGCRFPGADNPDSFWQLLVDGREAIGEVPPDRWDVESVYGLRPSMPGKTSTRWGGFLRDVDKFDADFFGISAVEAERMDPQQRLVLEVVWEALENANILPAALAGTRTGVFLGISHSDYDRLIYQDYDRISPHHGTSTYHCIAANRVSYVLDLRGPSLAVDTACSSSLVAAHLACQSLRCGECDLAIVGGVNLILSPEETIGLSQCGLMALDGRCKTFDETADGYVRGEGCGVLVLERSECARANERRILALIRGSAVNQNGLSNGLISPSGPAQQALIQQSLANSGVAPADIDYVEAQGTGTSLGDSIEFRTLQSGLAEGRAFPCRVGSVKTNIGHLEAASGVASMIKVVLALQNRCIPAHLNLRRLNRYISIDNTPFAIPAENAPWPASAGVRLAAVTALGFGGTNCQLILQEGPSVPERTLVPDPPLQVLTLSAKTEAALRALAERYAERLADTPHAIADIAFTASTARSQFSHRLAAYAGSAASMRESLVAFARGKPASYLAFGRAARPPKIAFIVDGSCSWGEGQFRELYETEPAFRRAFDACDAALRRNGHRPLAFPNGGAAPAQDEVAGPAAFAVHYALAQLWQSRGVRPEAVVGVGLGHHVAACVSGVSTLDQIGERLSRCGAADAADATAAIERLRAGGIDLFLDVGSHRLLRGDEGQVGQMVPSPAAGGRERLLNALAELYVSGFPIQWHDPDRSDAGRLVAVPTYPFQRRRYWFEPSRPLLTQALRARTAEPLLRMLNESGRFNDEEKQLLPKLVEALLPDEGASSSANRRRALLAPMSASERERHIAAFLREAIAAITGIDTFCLGFDRKLADLGLHSRPAMVELQTRINGELGADLLRGVKRDTLVADLVSQLAHAVAPDARSTAPHPVTIQCSGEKTPLFLIHFASNTALRFQHLARALGDCRPIVGIEFQVAFADETCDGIEAVSTRYLDWVVKAHPGGLYHLAGWSLGVAVAYEMARQLEARGLRGGLLALAGGISPAGAKELLSSGELCLLESLALELGLAEGDQTRIVREDKDFARRIAHLFNRARAAQILPADADLASFYRLFASHRRAVEALGRYRAKDYYGPVLRFGSWRRPDSFWEPPCHGPSKFCEVSGDCFAMLHADQAKAWAELLNRHLDETTVTPLDGGIQPLTREA